MEKLRGYAPKKENLVEPIPDICLFFSPQTLFLVNFFSTQKRVNRLKSRFATKQLEWQQKGFCDKTAWIKTSITKTIYRHESSKLYTGMNAQYQKAALQTYPRTQTRSWQIYGAAHVRGNSHLLDYFWREKKRWIFWPKWPHYFVKKKKKWIFWAKWALHLRGWTQTGPANHQQSWKNLVFQALTNTLENYWHLK